MATYYVDGKNGNDNSGNGNSNNPWKSIGKAVASIKSGDTVKIRTAVYKEVVTVRANNISLQADDGHQPAIDGGYNEGLFSGGKMPPPDAYLPGSKYAALIQINGDSVTIDGLTVQNVAGRGIGCGGSRVTIRNCRVDFCYTNGINLQGSGGLIATPLIENNTVTRCSQKYYDPTHRGAPASGSISIGNSENAIVRHNIVAYGFGEGINCAKGCLNVLVEGNVVHTCNHAHLYINRARNTVLRNNFVYHLYLEPHLGQTKRPPSGIVIGDEGGPLATPFDHSSGSIIYNNIIVGMGTNFDVRNNSHNYDTQLVDTYIGYNTFVSRRMTRKNIEIPGNLANRPHQRSLFENNIIISNSGSISQATGNISGITFRNNLWSEPPDKQMRGPGERIGDARLVNATADITGKSPGPTNADPFNYQLTKNSALAIGSASNGSSVNGFRPPQVDRDFFGANRDNEPDLGAHEFGGQLAVISANFSIGPGQQAGLIPHTVDFTDRSSSDSPIVSWNWDFGDGSSSTERNASHTYMQPGNYSVSLTINDQNGQRDTIVETDLITALADVPELTPESFRRFLLVEDATDEVLAFGIQYPDLRCVLMWNSEPFHVANYTTIEDVARAHEVEGTTSLKWIDPALEPVEEVEIIYSEE